MPFLHSVAVNKLAASAAPPGGLQAVFKSAAPLGWRTTASGRSPGAWSPGFGLRGGCASSRLDHGLQPSRGGCASSRPIHGYPKFLDKITKHQCFLLFLHSKYVQHSQTAMCCHILLLRPWSMAAGCFLSFHSSLALRAEPIGIPI